MSSEPTNQLTSPSPPKLKRHSVVLMLLLAFVTGGIYLPSWFLLRRRALNNLNAKGQVGVLPVVVCVVVFSVLLLLSIFIDVEAEPAAALVDTGLQFVGGILILIQSFNVRHILEDHLVTTKSELSDSLFGTHHHAETSLSGIAVFFLTIFYLQYVINKRIVSSP